MNFEMTLFWAVVFIPLGLAVLIKGAGLLVDGAVSLAKLFGVSPIVIGLTIVAMGTSAPEVAASISAVGSSLKDSLIANGDMALGNVYGSNVANLALVAGVCSIIRPISVRKSVQKFDLPVMLAVACLLYPFVQDMFLSRLESVFLLAVFIGVMVYAVINAKKHPEIIEAELKPGEIQQIAAAPSRSLLNDAVLVIAGLAALAIGAQLTVSAAKYIGLRVGLSEAVVGATIVAVGTSLPELVTSLVAAFKGHDDISIGNLVGSNIFNTLFVTGLAGVVFPFGLSSRMAGNDFYFMVAVSLVFLGIALARKKIERISGVVLLCIYSGYMVYLFILTRNH